CPSIIAISPNGETWANSVTINFPDTFKFDDRYGALWQCEIEQAMPDPLYQTPHQPCGSSDQDAWLSDFTNADGSNCSDTPIPHAEGGGSDYFHAYPIMVESRITLPTNGGPAQDQTAPALPSGTSLGFVNPVVDGTNGLMPPGQIGYAPKGGNPIPAVT